MLTGKKVILRPPEIRDAGVLQKWYMDKEFRQAYDAYESIDMDSILNEIAQSKGIFDPQMSRLILLVLRARDQKPIGLCCMRDIDKNNGNAEVLLGIGEKDMRLAGFGLDTFVTLLDFAYYELGLHKTYMRVLESNPFGLQNALKFGYKPEGHLRDQAFVDGGYINVFFLGLLKDEYEKLSIVSRWKKRRSF